MKLIKGLLFLGILAVLAISLSPYYVKSLSKYPKIEQTVVTLHENFLKVPTGIGEMRSVAWNPDGRTVFAGAWRFTLSLKKIWSLYEVDVPTLKVKQVANYSGPDEIQKISFGGAGHYVALEFKNSAGTYIEILNYQSGSFIPLPAPNGIVFHSTSFAPSPLAFLPDGRKMLFTGFDGKKNSLCIFDLNLGVSSLVPVDSDVVEATWSPAGDKILFLAHRDKSNAIMTVSPDGTKPVSILDTGNNLSPRYSPYGQSIAFFQVPPVIGSPTLGIMNADGSNLDFTPGLPPNPDNLSWSSDGSQLFFQAKNERGPAAIYTYIPESHTLKKIAAGGESLSPTSEPEGHRLVFASNREFPWLFALYSTTPDSGEFRRLSGWFIL